MTAPILILKEAGIEPRLLRWKFELRQPDCAPVLIVVRSTLNAVLIDLQQIGTLSDPEWSAEVVEAISERVGEELARVNLARTLGDGLERRAA